MVAEERYVLTELGLQAIEQRRTSLKAACVWLRYEAGGNDRARAALASNVLDAIETDGRVQLMQKAEHWLLEIQQQRHLLRSRWAAICIDELGPSDTKTVIE